MHWAARCRNWLASFEGVSIPTKEPNGRAQV